jgi:hypothetical protein
MKGGSELRKSGDNSAATARRHIDLLATETSHLASGLCDVPELKTIIDGAYCRVCLSTAGHVRGQIRALAGQDHLSTDNFGESQ